MKVFALAVSAFTICVGGGAFAAASVPKLSGTYTVSTSTVCQASIPVSPTEVDVPPFSNGLPTTDDIIAIDKTETVNTGKVAQLLVTVTFTPGAKTPNAGTLTYSGTSWGGDLVFTGTEQGTSAGIGAQSVSGSGTYSNTAAQVTLNISSTSTVYQVLYAGTSGGAAAHAELVQVYSSNGGQLNDCIEHGEAVRN